jgi:hypothetical protein
MSFLRANFLKLLVLVVLGAALFWWVYIPWHIFENGEPAQARVVEVWDTNTTVNDEPLIGLRLEVQPTNAPAFQVERSCRWSLQSQHLFRSGAQVEVRLDPRFPGRVIMVSADCDQAFTSMWLTALGTIGFIVLSFIFAPVLANRFLFHSDLHRKGIPARAVVVKTWDTNVTINNKPQVGVFLHLRSETGEEMDIESKLVVPYASLASLYPGAEMQVKYDPRKPSRLIVLAYGPAQDQVDPAARLEKLEKLRAENLIFEEEYQQMRKSILDEI